MSNELISQSILTITSWSRPKRVAFLVNLEQTNDDELNQIIRYNIGVWGGRFNAIIPANGDDIAEAWWNMLVILDPDIIFSFFPLQEKLIKRINRYILPYRIFEITPDDRKVSGGNHLINTAEIGALDIQQIPQYVWTKRGSIREPYFFYIKDSGKNTPNDNFILRNFGAFPSIISLNTAFRDLPYESIKSKDTSSQECISKLLTKYGNAVLPLDLCKMFAHLHYHPEYNIMNDGFHLVIGNNPLDIIYYWNRDIFNESIWGRNGFWLSKELSEDKDFLSLVCQWIKSAWWSWQHNKKGYIVSYSVDTDYLDGIAQKVSELVCTYFKPIKLETEQFPTPKVRSLRKYNYQQTEQIPLSENEGLTGFPKPEFLRDGHPQQGWMVDIEIPFHTQRYSSWTNFRPSWQLPKRLGLPNKFFNPSRESRVISNGLLSCIVTNSDQTIGIKIPSEQIVFWTFIENYHTNYWRKGERRELSEHFYDMRTSAEGKYLQGMIQLFGNLYHCGSFFQDHFWREIFLYMAGKPKNEFEQRLERTHKAMEDFLKEKGGSVSFSDGSHEVDEFAEIIARKLLLRDPESQLVDKEILISRFSQLRAEGLKSPRELQFWQTYKKFDEWRDRHFENLIENKILLQGSKIRCNTCGSTLWYPIDEIKFEMICNGCRTSFVLKTEPKWSYRLNDLVKNTLKKQGTLAMILALYKAINHLNGMFLLLPCQAFYEKDNNDPLAEVDIMYIADKKFVIGEVKSSPHFNTDDFDKLKMVAKKLEPNEVVIAAICQTLPPDIINQCKELALELEPLDVKVRPLPLQW